MIHKKVKLIVLLMFIGLISYSYIKDKIEKNMLKNNGLIAKAKITGCILPKSTLIIEYTFQHEGMNYFNNKSAKELSYGNVKKYLFAKKFPLILLSNYPDVNELLLFNDDFEKYNLSYPDSLKWICDSLKLSGCK